MTTHGIQGNLLEVTVVSCNKLKDTEWISRQDPYVCVEYGSNRSRTRTCTDGSTNPTFQEKFVYTLIEGLRELNVNVWNSNTVKHDDFIGSGKVQLAKAISMGFDDSTWPLQTKNGRHAGEVRLILSANKPSTSRAPVAPQFGLPEPTLYSAPPPTPSLFYPPSASGYPYPPPNIGGYPVTPPDYPGAYPSSYPPQAGPYSALPYPPNSAYPLQPYGSEYPPGISLMMKTGVADGPILPTQLFYDVVGTHDRKRRLNGFGSYGKVIASIKDSNETCNSNNVKKKRTETKAEIEQLKELIETQREQHEAKCAKLGQQLAQAMTVINALTEQVKTFATPV